MLELPHERVCVIERVWVENFPVEHARVLACKVHGAAYEVGHLVERAVCVEPVKAIVEEQMNFNQVALVDLPRVDNVGVRAFSAPDGARDAVLVDRALFRAHVSAVALVEKPAPAQDGVNVVQCLVPLLVGAQDHVADVAERGLVARIFGFVEHGVNFLHNPAHACLE